jgi:hypothetical protein
MIIVFSQAGGHEAYAKKLGYETSFLDNGFVQGELSTKKLIEGCRRAWPKYAVLPDNDNKAVKICSRALFDEVALIYPLHRKKDLNFAREHSAFIGFPHRKQWRDYSLSWLVKQEEINLWYLGYWDSRCLDHLLLFDGFDTTMPSYLSLYYLKWIRPKTYKPVHPHIEKRYYIVQENLKRFMEYFSHYSITQSIITAISDKERE